MRVASPVRILLVAVSVGAIPCASLRAGQVVGPTAVPGAPVLTHSVVGTTVTLSWTPATTGGAPTGYSLEASLSAGGPAFTVIPVASTSLTVPGVPSGTYFVRVKAVNAEGAGPSSNEETVVVGGACAQPPGAPGPLVASPPGPTVTLNWSPPIGGCPATGFVLRAGFAPGQPVFDIPVGTNTSFSGTAAAGTYFVSVVAVNAAGAGPASNEVQVIITCLAPGPPIGLSANVNGRSVTLGWGPPTSGGAAAGYRLEAGSSSGAADLASFDLPANTFSTAAPDGTYFVRVRATNACPGGVSPPSNEVTVVVPNCGPAPGAPSTPTATVANGVATVSWGAVNGAARYRLDVGTASGASNTSTQFVTGTTQALAGLPAGNYFMRVVALNACNNAGPASGEGQFTIVTPVQITSIAVTGPTTLVVGQSGQFTAMATFSNQTTQNVTGTAAWTTTNGTVAAPVSSGTISALAVGDTTVRATQAGVTGNINLQVVQPTATFVVVTDPGTIPPARAGQCLVRRRAENEPNHLLCDFDGRASVPDNATYAWEIPVGTPNGGNSDFVDGRALSFGCGTLGEDATADDFDIRLTVTVGGVSVVETRRISFLKAGAC